jgi:hypothetical protein
MVMKSRCCSMNLMQIRCDVTAKARQACCSAIAIETGPTLRRAFHEQLRQTRGVLRSMAGALGIVIVIPDHTTLSCRAGSLPILPKRIDGDEQLYLLVDSWEVFDSQQALIAAGKTKGRAAAGPWGGNECRSASSRRSFRSGRKATMSLACNRLSKR